ncbi:MAG: hypothetical protein KF777_05190 [Planctomycetaceae bacterium]|nr:hypothetical protein [Planctomycetaceae bacterium]
MAMLDRAADAVRHCETQLRTLIAQASAAGDYDAVDRLTQWARTLSALLSQENSAISPGVGDSPVSASAGSRAPGPLPAHVVGGSIAGAFPASRTRHTAKRGAKQDYPRFSRQRNDLVKTGWSKKDRQEYQHRAPWAVVEALARRLNDERGKVFTSDDVFPLTSPDGTDIPSYQAYLCLAWLRFEGLVVQEGRQGYFISTNTDVLVGARERWESIAS